MTEVGSKAEIHRDRFHTECTPIFLPRDGYQDPQSPYQVAPHGRITTTLAASRLLMCTCYGMEQQCGLKSSCPPTCDGLKSRWYRSVFHEAQSIADSKMKREHKSTSYQASRKETPIEHSRNAWSASPAPGIIAQCSQWHEQNHQQNSTHMPSLNTVPGDSSGVGTPKNKARKRKADESPQMGQQATNAEANTGSRSRGKEVTREVQGHVV